MRLQTSGRHLYEPLLGIVLFEMRDKDDVVHCMVSVVHCGIARWLMAKPTTLSKTCSASTKARSRQ